MDGLREYLFEGVLETNDPEELAARSSVMQKINGIKAFLKGEQDILVSQKVVYIHICEAILEKFSPALYEDYQKGKIKEIELLAKRALMQEMSLMHQGSEKEIRAKLEKDVISREKFQKRLRFDWLFRKLFEVFSLAKDLGVPNCRNLDSLALNEVSENIALQLLGD